MIDARLNWQSAEVSNAHVEKDRDEGDIGNEGDEEHELRVGELVHDGSFQLNMDRSSTMATPSGDAIAAMADGAKKQVRKRDKRATIAAPIEAKNNVSSDDSLSVLRNALIIFQTTIVDAMNTIRATANMAIFSVAM